MSPVYLEPTEEGLQHFLDTFPADTPVVMLNLLRFLDQAAYEEGQPGADEPCSGAEAFGRYGQVVNPLIEGCGGEVVWQGSQRAMVIGPDDKDWHLVVLVQYPSAQTFLDMVRSEAYEAIVHHRSAALSDSRLIALQAF